MSFALGETHLSEYNDTMVITLQNVPAEIEAALQRKAAEEGKSVDRVTLDALALGLGVNGLEEKQDGFSDIAGPQQTSAEMREIFEKQRRIATLQPGKKRDLSFIAGTWVEDPEFEAALEEQRQIDPEMWK